MPRTESTQESKKTCFQKDAKSEANKNRSMSYNFQTAGDTIKVNTPNKRARRELLNAAKIKKI